MYTVFSSAVGQRLNLRRGSHRNQRIDAPFRQVLPQLAVFCVCVLAQFVHLAEHAHVFLLVASISADTPVRMESGLAL